MDRRQPLAERLPLKVPLSVCRNGTCLMQQLHEIRRQFLVERRQTMARRGSLRKPGSASKLDCRKARFPSFLQVVVLLNHTRR
jgi:hypothetical protein